MSLYEHQDIIICPYVFHIDEIVTLDLIMTYSASIMEKRGGVFQIALDVRTNFFLSIPVNISAKFGVHLRVSKNL